MRYIFIFISLFLISTKANALFALMQVKQIAVHPTNAGVSWFTQANDATFLGCESTINEKIIYAPEVTDGTTVVEGLESSLATLLFAKSTQSYVVAYYEINTSTNRCELTAIVLQ